MENSALLQQLFSYKNLVHAVSGAMGGFTAMTVFYPLDTVRVVLQVDDSARRRAIFEVFDEIIKKHGLCGLYSGWFPVVSSLWCSNFVYFYSYNLFKLSLYGNSKPSSLKDLTAASIAGVINVLTTTPMWVVNTRLKLQGSQIRKEHTEQGAMYNGILDCFKKIISQEGVSALWNGTLPSLLLVCNPTIQFVVYESLKRKCIHTLKSKELGSLTLFLIGAVAKAVATIITYPVQVLQSRLRIHNRLKEERKTVTEIIRHVLRTHGVKGFYKGIEAKLLQTILMAALMFMTYEKISSIVFKFMGLS